MNLAVLASAWAPVLALAAYRLTRLWVDDTLPPLPRVRASIAEWAGRRWDEQEELAVERDRLEQATMATPRLNALRAPTMATPRLNALRARRMAAGNQPAVTYLIDCYWCAGFWIALGVVLIAVLIPVSVWAIPVAALAISATTGLLSRFAELGE